MAEKVFPKKQEKIDALLIKYEKIIEDMGEYEGDGRHLDGGRTRFTPIGEQYRKELIAILEADEE